MLYLLSNHQSIYFDEPGHTPAALSEGITRPVPDWVAGELSDHYSSASAHLHQLVDPPAATSTLRADRYSKAQYTKSQHRYCCSFINTWDSLNILICREEIMWPCLYLGYKHGRPITSDWFKSLQKSSCETKNKVCTATHFLCVILSVTNFGFTHLHRCVLALYLY